MERLRRGEVTFDDVRLAAHTGDPGARLVGGHPGCGVCNELGSLPGELLGRPGERVACHLHAEFEAWCAPLLEVPEVARRAAVAALTGALAVQGDPSGLIDSLAAWRDCPCDAHEREVRSRALARGGLVDRLVQRALVEGATVLGDVARRLSSEAAVRVCVQDDIVPWLLKLPGADPASASVTASTRSVVELELETWSAWVGARLLDLAGRLDVALVRRAVWVAVTDDPDAADRLREGGEYGRYRVRQVGRSVRVRTEAGGVVAVVPDREDVAVELAATVSWPPDADARALEAWARATAPGRRRLPVDRARRWAAESGA